MFGSKIRINSVSLCYFVYFILFGLGSGNEEKKLPDSLVAEAYKSYLNAVNIEEGTVSARRVFLNDRQYDIHVMKLNEVNGKKRHNLLIKESNETNPLIYINNPLETKLPHPYLTLEEFKKELTDRVKKQRQQFLAKMKNANNIVRTVPNTKEKAAKAFKTFVDRLIKIQREKIKEYRDNSTTTIHNASSEFRLYTIKNDEKSNTTTKKSKPTKKVKTEKYILRNRATKKPFTVHTFNQSTISENKTTTAAVIESTLESPLAKVTSANTTNTKTKDFTTLAENPTEFAAVTQIPADITINVDLPTEITTVTEVKWTKPIPNGKKETSPEEIISNKTSTTAETRTEETTTNVGDQNYAGSSEYVIQNRPTKRPVTVRKLKQTTVKHNITTTPQIESPIVRATSENTTSNSEDFTTIAENTTEYSAATDFTKNVDMPSEITTAPENHTDLEDTEKKSLENTETSPEEQVSTTISTTTKQTMTKRSTLDRPLVWIQDERDVEDVMFPE